LRKQLAQHLRSSSSKDHPPTPRGTWRNFGETRDGVRKSGVLEHKMAISLKRVKIEENLLYRAYRKSSTLFRFFGSLPYFYFRFRIYGHRDGRFLLPYFGPYSPAFGTMLQMDFLQCWNCRGVGVEPPPPVHVYRRSFSEIPFKISIPVQNFKHFSIWPPSSFRSIPTLTF